MRTYGLSVFRLSLPITSTLVLHIKSKILLQRMAILCILSSELGRIEKITAQKDIKAVMPTPTVTKSAERIIKAPS